MNRNHRLCCDYFYEPYRESSICHNKCFISLLTIISICGAVALLYFIGMVSTHILSFDPYRDKAIDLCSEYADQTDIAYIKYCESLKPTRVEFNFFLHICMGLAFCILVGISVCLYFFVDKNFGKILCESNVSSESHYCRDILIILSMCVFTYLMSIGLGGMTNSILGYNPMTGFEYGSNSYNCSVDNVNITNYDTYVDTCPIAFCNYVYGWSFFTRCSLLGLAPAFIVLIIISKIYVEIRKYCQG